MSKYIKLLIRCIVWSVIGPALVIVFFVPITIAWAMEDSGRSWCSYWKEVLS